MPGKVRQPSSRMCTNPLITLFHQRAASSSKNKSTASSSSRSLKPSLLPLKPHQAKLKSKKPHKAADRDAREKLDQDGLHLRAALDEVVRDKPLVKKKEAPAELAQGGDPLAQSLDDLSVAFGGA
ncbi:hypothetical protein JCM8097_007039 [Rhodosporidiobolus ruineniae]